MTTLIQKRATTPRVNKALSLRVRRAGAGFAAVMLSLFMQGSHADAQPVAKREIPPVPGADTGYVHQSTGATLIDLGTRFLDRLGNWSNFGGATGPSDFNPEGSGGPAPASPRYRTWIEGYATQSRAGAQGTFIGDSRKTFGTIAGLGATLTPDLNVGFSVDRSRTKVDVDNGLQNAIIDLTQLGLTGAYRMGSFVLGVAAVYAFGDIDSTRDTLAGDATSSYGAHLWAGIAELNYLWSIKNFRIVPKIGADWIESRVDPFTEMGGFQPVSGLGQTYRRTRVFAGVEVGHTWLVGTTILDLSAYGKLVDVVSQEVSALQVSAAGTQALTIQGVTEAQYGADTGAALSAFLTQTVRAYALYDGKFRDGFQSNTGTVGLEVKW